MYVTENSTSLNNHASYGNPDVQSNFSVKTWYANHRQNAENNKVKI